ncbi:Tectonic-2 [Porites harrisoni]
MKVSSGSSPTAAHSSLPSPTASSLSSHLTVSSSVSPPASGTENTRNYPPHFQYFMVTSSVVFIKVPAVKSQRVKRSVDQTGICYRDVCKEELFLPLTEAYQGEPREKSLALSLFLIFLALVTFAVTRPWG